MTAVASGHIETELPELLKLPEVAKRLRVSKRTLEREIERGRLAAVKIGRSVRIAPAALAAYFALITTGQPAQ